MMYEIRFVIYPVIKKKKHVIYVRFTQRFQKWNDTKMCTILLTL